MLNLRHKCKLNQIFRQKNMPIKFKLNPKIFHSSDKNNFSTIFLHKYAFAVVYVQNKWAGNLRPN